MKLSSKRGIDMEGNSFCPKCGSKFVPGEIFCGNCGYRVAAFSAPNNDSVFASGQDRVQNNLPQNQGNIMSNGPIPPQAYQRSRVPETRQPGKSKLPLFIGIGAAALVVIAIVLFAIPSGNVNRGKDLLEQGQYDEAIDAFKAAGTADTAEELNEANYGKAKQMLENGDYDGAAAIFADLGSFKDSKDQLFAAENMQNYDKANDLLSQNKPESALVLFEELGDFKDCEQLALKAKVAIAQKLVKAEDYSGAAPLVYECRQEPEAQALLGEIAGANNLRKRVRLGETFQARQEDFDGNFKAKGLVWASSDEAVAKVDQDGEVKITNRQKSLYDSSYSAEITATLDGVTLYNYDVTANFSSYTSTWKKAKSGRYKIYGKKYSPAVENCTGFSITVDIVKKKGNPSKYNWDVRVRVNGKWTTVGTYRLTSNSQYVTFDVPFGRTLTFTEVVFIPTSRGLRRWSSGMSISNLTFSTSSWGI